MPTSTKILDHIVHLTPVGSLEETKQQWKDLGFTVLTGGQHADGFTENALVIFSDLVYIELITFIHPPEYYIPGSPLYLKRIGQPWANKPPGWVSYAFGGDVHADPSIAKLVNTRLKDAGSAFSYDGPKDGGRTRPDGIVLKWELTVPSRWQELVNGMGLPFYCADVTPRDQRVPSDKEYQSHANAAKSIAFLRLLVPRDAFADASKALQAIIGDAPTTSSADDSSAKWTLGAPGPGPLPKLVLSTPKDDEEEAYVKEYGLALFEVGFLVGEGGKSGQTSTPFGRVTWVVGDT